MPWQWEAVWLGKWHRVRNRHGNARAANKGIRGFVGLEGALPLPSSFIARAFFRPLSLARTSQGHGMNLKRGCLYRNEWKKGQPQSTCKPTRNILVSHQHPPPHGLESPGDNIFRASLPTYFAIASQALQGWTLVFSPYHPNPTTQKGSNLSVPRISLPCRVVVRGLCVCCRVVVIVWSSTPGRAVFPFNYSTQQLLSPCMMCVSRENSPGTLRLVSPQRRSKHLV